MIRTEPFDPDTASPDAWAAFHAFRRARAMEDDPGEPILPDADFEHGARKRWPFWKSSRILAVQDGTILGSVALSVRREGTDDYAAFAPFVTAWGGVLWSERRQGIGTALLRPLLAFMQDHGKTTATSYGRTPDSQAFLAAIGATRKQLEVENRLPFSGLDWTGLARWEAAAPPTLRWEIHAGRVPVTRLEALVPAFTTLVRDVPTSSLDMPPNRFDLRGYATWYEEADRTSGEHFLIMLLDGDEVAGMCEAEWDSRFPDRTHQDLTAVARLWRGHGLAKALKARMLRLVRERKPGVTLMTTNNAASNAPMLSINARLGFVRHKEIGTYQVGPAALQAWLVSRTPRRDG